MPLSSTRQALLTAINPSYLKDWEYEERVLDLSFCYRGPDENGRDSIRRDRTIAREKQRLKVSGKKLLMHTIEGSIKRPHFSKKLGVGVHLQALPSSTKVCPWQKHYNKRAEKVSGEINLGQMNITNAASMTIPHLRVMLRSGKLCSCV